MTDLHFRDVVTKVRFEYDREINRLLSDPKPSKCQALCSTCGSYHEATVEELSTLAGEAELRYVASMRAWNCCHEGDTPYDGFPDEPEYHRINGPDADADG
jgi:hypothetical protein